MQLCNLNGRECDFTCIHLSFVQCSKTCTKRETRRYGFQSLFRCLGKHLEHQRKDRDQYIRILSENIDPGYPQHTVIIVLNNMKSKLDALVVLQQIAYCIIIYKQVISHLRFEV